MSHVSNVKTKIKDLHCLLETIKSFGFSYYEGQALVSKFTSVDGTKVDIAMDMNGNRNLGFNLSKDGTYEFCGDFYGIKGGQEKFVNQFMQRYATLKVKSALKKRGMHYTETEVDGKIRLVVNL